MTAGRVADQGNQFALTLDLQPQNTVTVRSLWNVTRSTKPASRLRSAAWGWAWRGATSTGGACQAFASTRSRNSLPALKWGMLFAGTRTSSPVFGLRAARGALRFRLKLPKPRISTRSPMANAAPSASKTTLMACAQSAAESWGWWAASRTVSSERVMPAFYV